MVPVLAVILPDGGCFFQRVDQVLAVLLTQVDRQRLVSVGQPELHQHIEKQGPSVHDWCLGLLPNRRSKP